MEGPIQLINRGVGIVYYDLRKWDRAIEAFKKSLGECN